MWRFGLVLTGLLWATAAAAEPDRLQSMFSAEISVGHDSVNAPLIRLSDNEPLLLVDGVEHRSAPFVRSAASGMLELPLFGNLHAAFSGHVDVHRSSGSDEFGYAVASADLMLRSAAPTMSWGFGPTFQRTWVSGGHFRNTTALQADVFVGAADEGHWMAFASVGRYRHPGELLDLDANAMSFSVQRRWNQPVTWLNAIELEAGLLRERNVRELTDLSSRSTHARVSLEREWGGLDGYLAANWQRSKFDAASFDGDAPRKDQYVSLEFGVARELTKGWKLQLDASLGRNAANLEIYRQGQRSVTLTLAYAR